MSPINILFIFADKTFKKFNDKSIGSPYLTNERDDIKERWSLSAIVTEINYFCNKKYVIFTRITYQDWHWLESCLNDENCK